MFYGRPRGRRRRLDRNEYNGGNGSDSPLPLGEGEHEGFVSGASGSSTSDKRMICKRSATFPITAFAARKASQRLRVPSATR
jgi:hypothetical protein